MDLSTIAAGTGGFVINGQTAGDRSGTSVASAGDVNGDGFADLIIGAYSADPSGKAEAGKSYVVFGQATGFAASVNLSAIASGTGGFVINGQVASDRSGRSVAAAGDVNGDGFDDLIIGAYSADPTGKAEAGKSYVVFGHAGGFSASLDLATIAAGTGGFVINGQTAGDYSGHSVASAGDIDGDGFDDLIIGAERADPTGGSAAGKTYVIYGKDFTGSVTEAGSTASETLTGSAAADDIVAGLGDDVLDGQGGTDVLIAGGGNDTIRIADLTFSRVHGGAGIDMLALDGAGITLNLATIADTRIQDIEAIDLTGSGDNTLILSRLEVLNLSTTSNTVTVDRDYGDVVDFGAETWTKAGVASGYTTYTNGQATVLIAEVVPVHAAIELSTIETGIGGFVINGSGKLDASGYSVASAGDVNGDGFEDLIIGAPKADQPGANDAGKTYVVFGQAAGFGASVNLSTIAVGTGGFVINGQDQDDQSGRSVASAGDVNGDGFDDLIISAPGASPNSVTDAGKSYVVFGQGGGFGASVALSAIEEGTGGFVINGVEAFDRAGVSVASAGDVNGDGIDDLIIGADRASPAGGTDAGKSYVVFGQSGGGTSVDLAAVEAGTGGFVINGQSAQDRSGFSVASAGDLNGDGFNDLVVGAFGADPAGGGDAGKTYVVFGEDGDARDSVDLSTIAAGTGGFVINGENGSDRSGKSVAAAGDVNGDGFADLIIGTPDADPTAGSAAGRSYVVFGQSGGYGAGVDLSAIAAGTGGFVINGATAYDRSGFSVASAGDINGDGFDDLIIGASYASIDAFYEGKSFVVFGRGTSFGASVDLSTIESGIGGFVINGHASSDYSGFSVASAGDINGDGFGDLIVGAPSADPASTSGAGKSYVIFGSVSTGAVTKTGTTASETLTGSAAADDIVADLGDDVLDGKGGVDVLIGGGGNDTIRVADLTFNRLDGGSGTDTMALDGAGITLDLSTIANPRIQDIEAIDITGSGNNTLVLSRLEVLNLSTTSNTLTVEGNAGDTMNFGAELWNNDGVSGGYTTYSNGNAIVRVATAVLGPLAAIELSTIEADTGGFVINGQTKNDLSGFAVASAGDVNGDGFDDLIVAAPFTDQGGNTNTGKIYVVFGHGGGFGVAVDLSAVAAGTGGFVINGEGAGDTAGRSASSAGDINGDGYDDLIIGAPGADPAGRGSAGSSYVVFGQGGGFGASVDLSAIAAGTGGFVINGQDTGDSSGYSVASADDINGDGFDDLIIGAPHASKAGASSSGKSYVVFGHGGAFAASVELTTIASGSGGFVINGQAEYEQSGLSVASAGDINGDGFDDLVIGAPLANSAGEDFAGKAFVVFGHGGSFGARVDLSTIASGTGGFVINGLSTFDLSGYSVASAGDVNGDGFGDLIIGAPLADLAGENTAGKSYVVFGQSGGFGASVDLAAIETGTGGFVINGDNVYDQSAASVASAGDINGDGFDDLIIGAVGADTPGQGDAGKSYVVFGKGSGFGAGVDLGSIEGGAGGFVINGQANADRSGRSVASAGDINGDGFDDLIVGAYGASPAAGADAGKSYVILGSDFTRSVTKAGTTTSETLTGSTSADDIVADLGDDILDGQGGADILIGGGGNDTLKIADLGFQRLHGGSGMDTVALDGSGLTLDLATISDIRIQDIEAIDLAGSGNNTLILSALEVLTLSTTSNTLTVHGGAGDAVDIGTESWTKSTGPAGYTSYTRGQATVLVDNDISVACFAAGTRIATATGDVVVEDLRVGDSVALASGATRPVRWIGWRALDLTRHPNPRLAQPIRIQAGAFADGVPARDLRVSPDHAVFIDGVLIPARLLVNHRTITQETTCASVVYYHVELDAHDVLLAEGLPAESYLDTGNRGMFANAGLPLILHPDLSGQAGREALSCAPFAAKPDLVKPAWDRLANRANGLGVGAQMVAVDGDPDFRVAAAGRVLRPVVSDGDRHTFMLPAGCETISLLSRACAPADLEPWREDRRALGLSVRRIRLTEGACVTDIALDRPDIGKGWWAMERDGGTAWRWTDGKAELWVGTGGPRMVEITAGCLGAYVVPDASDMVACGGVAERRQSSGAA